MSPDARLRFVLEVPVVTLRRSLERNARRAPDGGTVARVDGITARKLGRLWRVWLDAGWTHPDPVAPAK